MTHDVVLEALERLAERAEKEPIIPLLYLLFVWAAIRVTLRVVNTVTSFIMRFLFYAAALAIAGFLVLEALPV